MKLNTRTLFYAFMIMVYLAPGKLANAFLPYSSYIFLLAQFAYGVYFIFKYGNVQKNKKMIYILIVFLLSCSLGIFFVRTSLSIKELVRYVCWTVSLVGLFVFMCDYNEKEISYFLSGSKLMYVISVFLTWFYGRSINEFTAYGKAVFFWGSEAVTTQTFIMFFTLSVYSDLKYKKKISIFSIVFGVINMLFCISRNSGQGITMMGILVLLLVLDKIWNRQLWKILSPGILLCIIAFIYYFVVTLAFQKIDILVYYITEVLHKDITLTGRDFIYKGALQIYRQHPWIGYGYNNHIINDVLGRIAAAFNTAHNSMLQMLVDYGRIGVGLFIYLVYTGMSFMKKTSQKYASVCYFAVVAMFIGGLVNMIIPTTKFWIVFFLGSSTAIASKYKEEKQEKAEIKPEV